MIDEQWLDVAGYPNYEVSNLGQLRSKKSGNLLHPSKNQHGHLKVNLAYEGRVKTRQLNRLVAEAFLETPHRSDFISVIHIDGDKTNCAASNLAWRPRYFAIRYHLQFETALWKENHTKIIETKTGRIYNTIQEAVLEHGLIMSEILVAAHNRTFVWPTYQQFRIIDEIG